MAPPFLWSVIFTPNSREKSSHPISLRKNFVTFFLSSVGGSQCHLINIFSSSSSFSARGKSSGALLWRCQTLFTPPPEVNSSTLSPGREVSDDWLFSLSSLGLSKRESFTLEWNGKIERFGRYRSYFLCWVRMFVKGGPPSCSLFRKKYASKAILLLFCRKKKFFLFLWLVCFMVCAYVW